MAFGRRQDRIVQVYCASAHHDIWLHRENRSQSGESRNGRTCCRLDPIAFGPLRTAPEPKTCGVSRKPAKIHLSAVGKYPAWVLARVLD